jgi:phosphoglycerate dehydrogenase-like enzyme
MHKTKVLFTFSYGDENFKKLEDLGYEITYIPEAELTEEIHNVPYEVLVCFNPFQKISIPKMPSLKWIQLVSKGINHVPLSDITKLKIQVTNNSDSTAIPIAEWIISYLFQIFKQTKNFYNRQVTKSWQPNHDILEFYGKKIGFLGTGNIATQTAIRLKPFHTTIYGVNSSGHDADSCFDQIYDLDHLDEFYSLCDVIISTLPSTTKTYHLLNEKAFSKMKPTVSLINISRGDIIHEQDLIARLKQGFFRGVALDVFETEPLPASSPLWDFDNVIITPHTALYSDLYQERVFEIIYENMQLYKEHKILKYNADFAKGY